MFNLQRIWYSLRGNYLNILTTEFCCYAFSVQSGFQTLCFAGLLIHLSCVNCLNGWPGCVILTNDSRKHLQLTHCSNEPETLLEQHCACLGHFLSLKVNFTHEQGNRGFIAKCSQRLDSPGRTAFLNVSPPDFLQLSDNNKAFSPLWFLLGDTLSEGCNNDHWLYRPKPT